jgi:transcription termination factor Rho
MCYPKEKMHFMAKEMPADHTEKCLEWLLPLGKGQRGLVVGAPKSGKSQLLIQMAQSAYKANKNLQVLAVLVGESLENIRIYQNAFKGEHLLYTSYDEDVERQVEIAELALQRAKRMAENGQDVLLVVDSLQNLAHAFNDTDASEGGKLLIGNLESKTLFYCKKYFGTARCFTTKGSITMLCSFATETGNPADDILKAELTAISNLEIVLSEDLARRRVYPAIDILKSMGKGTSHVSGFRDDIINEILRSDYLSHFDIESLHQLLVDSNTFEEVEAKAMATLRKTGTKKKTEKEGKRGVYRSVFSC